MRGLLDYLVEQAKDIDPTAFTLSKATEFKKTFADLDVLPFVDFNVDTDGEPVWLRVHRLEPTRAPALPEPALAPFIAIGDDPAGRPPALRESALTHSHGEDVLAAGDAAATQRDDARRAQLGRLLEVYTQQWNNWALLERPRRQVISLYADLFALKTRLESEEAVRPIELVWGIGVASWRIPCAGSTGADFHYPLITQALELEIDSASHGICVQPRQTAPRLERNFSRGFGV